MSPLSSPVRSTRSPAPRAAPRASPRAGPRSPRPWPRTWRAPRRAPPVPPRGRQRSLSFSKPCVISLRNWWSGEPSRVGSSSWASREASPSKYVPSSVPHAPDRAVALGLVKQVRHEPAQLPAIAQEALQRLWQPASRSREVRAQDLVQLVRGALVGRRVALQQRVELPAHHLHVDRRAASWSACRPMRSARSIRSGRSSGARCSTKAASARPRGAADRR